MTAAAGGAPKGLWDRSLERLKNSTPDYAFKNWFSQIREIRLEDGRLTLGVPNFFVRDWLLEHYFDVLRKAVHSAAEQPVEIEFVIDPRDGPGPGAASGKHGDDELHELEIPQERARVRLREHFTFDNFVVGPSNQLAAAAALAVADRPGEDLQPALHLRRHRAGEDPPSPRHRQPDPRARSQRSHPVHLRRAVPERVPGAPAQGRMEDFRKKFREEVDILMMDDIQVLKKAQETQNEFFHTFNDLSDAGKAIVLTSDIHPNELPTSRPGCAAASPRASPRTSTSPRSRSGSRSSSARPELERLHLSDEVAHFVAGAIQRNVRELEGALDPPRRPTPP